MRVGVLAVQGAFIEHEFICTELGADVCELRTSDDLRQPLDALILPGGESTTQSLLLHQLNMFETIRLLIEEGMPVMGTCAGMILLAANIAEGEDAHLATMPIHVKRNGYGRQLGSFVTMLDVETIHDFSAHFIRAPYIEDVGPEVEVLAQVDGKIVAARYENQIAYAFHPELGGDYRLHRDFLRSVR